MSLISTYDVRVWMGLPEGDRNPNPKLSSITRAVEDFCDTFTGRKLEATRYNSDPQNTYLSGTGKRWIYLPQYPVSYVAEVNVDSERTFGSSTQIDLNDVFFEPNGKLVSEAGYFIRGRRNVKVDYIAGFAPVVGDTHNMSVSTYPIPLDLKQVMVEMCVESFKEGLTAVHTVQGNQVTEPKFIQMLSRNSFWSQTLGRYKTYDNSLGGYDE